MLFAEGSTGDGNMLLPFKSTLFGAAAKAIAGGAADKVYVQPVAFAYTRLHGMPMGRRHRPIAAWIGDQDLVPHLRPCSAKAASTSRCISASRSSFRPAPTARPSRGRSRAAVRAMMQAALADPRPVAPLHSRKTRLFFVTERR